MVGESKVVTISDVDFSKPIALFPLPNCVLVPRAIRPLHIFEPRYRDMVEDVVADQGLIAMALLKPGYEARYYSHFAAIHPTVCLGRIIRQERLPDGRYNALVQGVCRTRIIREDQKCSYRRGWLRPVNAAEVAGDAGQEIRARLLHAIDPAALASISPTGALVHVLNCAELPLSDAMDLAMFDIIPDPLALQDFLHESDVLRRADLLEHAIRRAGKTPDGSTPIRLRRVTDYVNEN